MGNRIVCPNCGHSNASYWHNCRSCGAILAPGQGTIDQDHSPWHPSPPPLDTTEMVLISVVVALLLACFIAYWMLNSNDTGMVTIPLGEHPELLLLACPVSLVGLLGSIIAYRVWWRDPSHSYALLGIMLLLVLAAGMTISWLVLNLFSNA